MSKKETAFRNLFRYIKQPEQKKKLYLSLCLFGFWLLLYLYFYPDPVLTGDSGSYIMSAYRGIPNGVRPIGYSSFLSFLHIFSSSIHFVIYVQYILLYVGLFFFYFTIDYEFKLKRVTSYFLNIMLFFSPSLFFLGDMIMSDVLFLTLTLLWLCTAFWLIEKPDYPTVIIHLILLYFAIDVRYLGLFYPIITVGVLIYAFRKRSVWLIPIMIIMIGFLYFHTENRMKQTYGIKTFTEFSGWALCNNAVSMLPYLNKKSIHFSNRNLQNINRIFISFPDSVYSSREIMATHFMWKNGYPGKTVMFDLLRANKGLQYTQAWLLSGEMFSKYAKKMILWHPFLFFRHYVLLNLGQLLWPKRILGGYRGNKKVNNVAKTYYGVNSKHFQVRYDFYGKIINKTSRIINLLIWLLSFGSVILALFNWKKLKINQFDWVLLIIIAAFIIFYTGGGLIAQPIIYRYLLPVLIVLISIPTVIIDKYLQLTDNS